MDLADNPAAMVDAVVREINLWERIDNGRVVGTARGINGTETAGTPGWCVGEVVFVLERRTDPEGRPRVRVRTAAGVEGWVTSFFLLE